MVNVRFGKWHKILEKDTSRFHQNKDAPLQHCASLCTAYYARGIAFATLSKVKEAREEQKKFKTFYKELCVGGKCESYALFNNPLRHIYEIAGGLLDAECTYREGVLAEDKEKGKELIDKAFGILRHNVKLNDGGSDITKGLIYDEPWGWMHPIRHVVGALGIEQKMYEEAFTAYAQDLGICKTTENATMVHPNNIWSLKGLSQLFQVWGKELNEEEQKIAKWVKESLAKAEGQADTKIHASCACQQVWIDS